MFGDGTIDSPIEIVDALSDNEKIPMSGEGTTDNPIDLCESGDENDHVREPTKLSTHSFSSKERKNKYEEKAIQETTRVKKQKPCRRQKKIRGQWCNIISPGIAINIPARFNKTDKHIRKFMLSTITRTIETVVKRVNGITLHYESYAHSKNFLKDDAFLDVRNFVKMLKKSEAFLKSGVKYDFTTLVDNPTGSLLAEAQLSFVTKYKCGNYYVDKKGRTLTEKNLWRFVWMCDAFASCIDCDVSLFDWEEHNENGVPRMCVEETGFRHWKQEDSNGALMMKVGKNRKVSKI